MWIVLHSGNSAAAAVAAAEPTPVTARVDEDAVQTGESQKPRFNCTVTMHVSSCSLCSYRFSFLTCIRIQVLVF